MNAQTISLKPIGNFTQDEKWDEDYDSEQAIPVPFLDGQEISFSLIYYPEDKNFLADAQKLLDDFFQLTVKNRNLISDYVWQNCREFLDAIEYDEYDQPLHDIQQAVEVWQFISPTSAQIMRDEDSGKLFLLLYCDCQWEQEHGLQLTLKEGIVLTAVSAIECYAKDDGLEVDLLNN